MHVCLFLKVFGNYMLEFDQLSNPHTLLVVVVEDVKDGLVENLNLMASKPKSGGADNRPNIHRFVASFLFLHPF
jgi:hypothetical protein